MYQVKKNNFIYSVLLMITLLATLVSGCGSFRSNASNSAAVDSKDIKSAEVRKGNISVSISSNGLLVPIKTVSLYYQNIYGPLKKLYVKQNDKVKAGQPIAEITPVGLKDTIADQEATVKGWPIKLAQLEDAITNAQTNMNEAKAAFDSGAQQQEANDTAEGATDNNEAIKTGQERQRLQAQYDLANRNYQNALSAKEMAEDQYQEEKDVYEVLSPANNSDYNQEVIQHQYAMKRLKIQLKQADANVSNAKTNLDQAKAALDSYEQIDSNNKIVKENSKTSKKLSQDIKNRQLKLQYEMSKSSYQNALWNKELASIEYERGLSSLQKLKDDLADSVLRAPLDGKVIFLESLAVNEMVGSGTVIAKIADSENTVFQVTYTDAKYVGADSQAELTIDKKKYKAAIYSPQPGDQLTPAGSQAANSSFLFLKFVSPAPEMETNKRSKGDVRIYKNDTLLIPKTALKQQDEKYSVDILENGKIRTVAIERGLANDAMVEVLSGLQPGQKVVLGY